MAVLTTILTAVITFAATNIDDIFVLMMFFSQTNDSFRQRHVIVGQYVGFVGLILVSLLGFLGSFVIPKEFIGLLGLAPILIGIRKAISHEDEIESTHHQPPAKSAPSIAGIFLHPKTYSVAAITFANGGDNIGIYTPLFASMDISGLVITVITFLCLVLLLCWIGSRLTHQKHIAQVLSRYGHILVPLVLIVLGIYIIVENGTLGLFGLYNARGHKLHFLLSKKAQFVTGTGINTLLFGIFSTHFINASNPQEIHP